MVLASTLADRRVMSTDGRELGTVENMTFDTTSGTLRNVSVTTDAQKIFGVERGPDGTVRLPATLIESVEDHLIIRPPEERIVSNDPPDQQSV